jgi:hypothetical protein
VCDEILVMASVEASDAGPVGGRLVVSRDAERLALFTGELARPGDPWSVPPLAIDVGTGGEMRTVFDGPMMTFPSHTPFLDLERGLADGTVIEGSLDVVFRPDGAWSTGTAETFGAVGGDLVIDGRRTRVASRGLAVTSVPAGARRLPSCRVTLPASAWGTVALATDVNRPLQSEGMRWRGAVSGVATALAERGSVSARVVLALGGATPSMTLESGGRILAGTLERLIPVRRPGRDGSVVETTFALFRVAGACAGWVEVSMLSAT